MKKDPPLSKATKTVYTFLRQIATLIPREFVNDAAAGRGVRWRTFDPWSRLITLVVVQLSRQELQNGICDVARAIAYEWDRAGLELPRRNTLSNANTVRDPGMAEDVFWKLPAISRRRTRTSAPGSTRAASPASRGAACSCSTRARSS